MRHNRLLTLAALFIYPLVNGQDALMQQAENELVMASYAEAHGHFEEAAATFQQNNQTDKYTLCRLRMAECQLAMGEPQLALNLVQETEVTGESLNSEFGIQAIAMNLLGEIHLRSGRNDLALEELLKAEKLLEPNSLEQAKCYNDLGVVYWNNGNRELALQYHEKALAIRQSAANEKAVLQADSYNNIGLIYLQDLPSYAVDYFNKALAIYKNQLGNNHPKVASGYSNLAFATAYRGGHDKALEYLDAVMGIWNSTYAGDHPNKAFTISNKGRVAEMKGSYEEALIFQSVALQMYQRLYGEKHPEIANTHFLIGSVHQKQSDFKGAVESYQRSIYANLHTQNYQSVYDLPELRDYYNADILLSSLQSKAKALEALHFENSLKLKDIDGALAAYLACDELITKIRQLRLNESDKLRLGEVAFEVYENGISTALYLAERTFRKSYYRQLAFNFCERNKSAVLLDAINDTKARHFAGIPDTELSLEDSLKDQIIFLEQKLAGRNTSEKELILKTQLFTYEAALRAFIARLENQYPEYFKLKYSNSMATVESLQPLLNETTAVLSYFAGDKNIYAFLVTQRKYKVYTVKRQNDFVKNITGFRNAIKFREPTVFEKTSRALFAQLMPNLPANIRSLIVLPDGVIGTVPFEALVVSKDKEKKEVKYLLQDLAVSYDYSATLLADRITTKGWEMGEGILLSAPISFEKNEVQMQRLPDTEKEVNEIRFLFTSSAQQAKVALNTSASEHLIKSDELSSYRYLHFATHGMVDEAQPQLSRIFLSPDEQEDGSLYAGEIYGLSINAGLVNLSACETGLGKVTRGEGIIGLSRALMYAGAKNLVVSLWQVADASTAELMIEFYKQHLYNPDNALFAGDLRKAKLSLLQSEKYKSPYYWAPFILVGM